MDHHLKTHGKSLTNLYSRWQGIKSRCHNPNAANYPLYGEKGIAVCDAWKHSFETFESWALSNGYDKGKQIDRIDNSQGYTPDNCRWVTPAQNARNRTTTKVTQSTVSSMFLMRSTMSIREIAKKVGLSKGYTAHLLAGDFWKTGVT
jgi:hypothetical protein